MWWLSNWFIDIVKVIIPGEDSNKDESNDEKAELDIVKNISHLDWHTNFLQERLSESCKGEDIED